MPVLAASCTCVMPAFEISSWSRMEKIGGWTGFCCFIYCICDIAFRNINQGHFAHQPTHKAMTSSILDPSHGSAFPSTACIYLLRSAVDAGKMKLGITNHLAARLDSLRQSFGPLDLSRSVVIGAKTRRAAYNLENALKMVFAGPAWRVPNGPQGPGPIHAQTCNGHTEWYAAHAAEPMVAFVEEIIKRDEASGTDRFRIERGAERLEAWCQRAPSARARIRLSDGERAADAEARLAESEKNFRRVQAWMEVRRDHLIDIRPSLPGREELLGRVFTLRLSPVTDGRADEAARMDWEELVSACLVTYRYDHGCGTVSYFGGATMYAASSAA